MFSSESGLIFTIVPKWDWQNCFDVKLAQLFLSETGTILPKWDSHNWAVCTKLALHLVRNKVHPFRKSEMECDIGFVFFDLVITINPHFAKKTNLVYHHILIYLEPKWQTYAFFSFFHKILDLTGYLFSPRYWHFWIFVSG